MFLWPRRSRCTVSTTGRFARAASSSSQLMLRADKPFRLKISSLGRSSHVEVSTALVLLLLTSNSRKFNLSSFFLQRDSSFLLFLIIYLIQSIQSHLFSSNIWYEGSPVELHVALVEGHYLLLALSLLSSSCHSEESKLGIALTYPCKETTNAFKSL